MMMKISCAAMALFAAASVAHSAEPGTTPVPGSVIALVGCWAGTGEVMGKPVTITVTGKPIVQDAWVTLDAESSALADPRDHYSAHLIFGGASKPPKSTTDQILGFWADSFGGAFAALGRGESRADGFDITYQYPDDDFVNRWRLAGEGLKWQIAARDHKGVEKPFASYSLRKTACQPSPTVR